MIPITYLKGDATRPVGTGNKIICHIVNDQGQWGKGFVLALTDRWPEVAAEYRKWYQRKDRFQLGEVQFIQIPYDPVIVANMLCQHGLRSRDNPVPLRYDALAGCLHHIARIARFTGSSVHMPRIGCGLSGGKIETVIPIIEQELCARDVAVFVYDWEAKASQKGN